MDPELDAVVTLAQDLVRIPSLSGQEGAAVERCAQEMRSLGFDVELDEYGNALGVFGAGEPRRLFDGHVDTVDVGDGWSHDPFAGELHRGQLVGRGSVDMKGPVAAMIHGVARAARSGGLSGTTAVSVTTLEELAEGAALRPLVERLAPHAVVIAEPSGLQLMLAQKGRAEITVEVTGRIAHAAFPERGANALLGAAAILHALRARESPHDELLGDGILVPTEAITKPMPGVSIVPPLCRLRFDRRTLPGETEGQVLEEMASFLGAADEHKTTAHAAITNERVTTYTGRQLQPRRFLPAWRTAEAHPLAQAALTALPGAGVSVYLFCTNGSLTAGELDIPTIGFGPGQTELAHQPDEAIDIADLELGVDGFAQLASMSLEGVSCLSLDPLRPAAPPRKGSTAQAGSFLPM